MILSLFRKEPERAAGPALYRRAVDQARRPEFYERFGVADTVEGRTELVMLHLWLLLRRLKGEPAAERLARRISEAFFDNMDDSLREAGVGDLSVGRRIRKIGEDLHGRMAAYEAASQPGAASETLAAALARNVYGAGEAGAGAALAAYVRCCAARLGGQDVGRIAEGAVDFPDPLEGAPT